MTLIDKQELNFSDLSGADEVGNLFSWNNRLFRAINNESAEKVRSMFSIGIIDELINAGLFPNTWITDYKIEGFGLVVEHNKIQPVTYPREWSFSMLKDAAITELKVNLILKKYGYQTKDSHPNNIVFHGTIPMFVDLGSFSKIDPCYEGWLAYEKFLQSYYYPLRIWQDGNGYIARRIQIGSETEHIKHENYLMYRHPLLRKRDIRIFKKAINMYFKYKAISLHPSGKIKNKFKGMVGGAICFMKNKRLLPLQSFNFSSWIDKLHSIHIKSHVSDWGDYHNEISDIYKIGQTYRRFERIMELIQQHNIESVLELAGNAGLLSQLILEKTNVKKVICTDFDEKAVELMYISSRNKEYAGRLTPAILNFAASLSVSCEESPNDRFSSQAVLSLAVTHHLILTQKIPIDRIFKTVALFSKQYVFIEFMPLGLYGGKIIPEIPSWYTREWFRDSFKKHFRLLVEEQLDENRILFMGELKHSI